VDDIRCRVSRAAYVNIAEHDVPRETVEMPTKRRKAKESERRELSILQSESGWTPPQPSMENTTIPSSLAPNFREIYHRCSPFPRGRATPALLTKRRQTPVKISTLLDAPDTRPGDDGGGVSGGTGAMSAPARLALSVLADKRGRRARLDLQPPLLHNRLGSVHIQW
jgi:hypothetical protein